MKKVLAELHELINDLEDQGLTAEASSLQEVFVRVAQEADAEDDLSGKVKDLLGKYSAPELIAALAEQMEGKDTETMSFPSGDEPGGYGNEPREKIIDEFVTQVRRKENTPQDAHMMMNDRLRFNGHDTMGYNEFLDKVNPSVAKVSEFASGDEPGVQEPKERNIVPFPEQTPEHRKTELENFKKQMEEMNKHYNENYPYTTAPGPQTSR
jgi:hypothetical protein